MEQATWRKTETKRRESKFSTSRKIWSYSVAVSTGDFESPNPSSNLGKTLNPLLTNIFIFQVMKNKNIKLMEENVAS